VNSNNSTDFDTPNTYYTISHLIKTKKLRNYCEQQYWCEDACCSNGRRCFLFAVGLRSRRLDGRICCGRQNVGECVGWKMLELVGSAHFCFPSIDASGWLFHLFCCFQPEELSSCFQGPSFRTTNAHMLPWVPGRWMTPKLRTNSITHQPDPWLISCRSLINLMTWSSSCQCRHLQIWFP